MVHRLQPTRFQTRKRKLYTLDPGKNIRAYRFRRSRKNKDRMELATLYRHIEQTQPLAHGNDRKLSRRNRALQTDPPGNESYTTRITLQGAPNAKNRTYANQNQEMSKKHADVAKVLQSTRARLFQDARTREMRKPRRDNGSISNRNM